MSDKKKPIDPAISAAMKAIGDGKRHKWTSEEAREAQKRGWAKRCENILAEARKKAEQQQQQQPQEANEPTT